MEGPVSESRSSVRWWALGVIVFAVLVRAWHLTSWDMWTDEIHTLSISTTGNYSFGPAYITAPLNFILTGWATRILGAHELGARMVPFLAGVVTVALVYVLGRRWVGERAAVFAALFMALSPWHVYWSQTARHFSLQVLAVLVAVHGFLIFWRGGKRRGLWLAPVLFLVALAVHSSSAFFLVALLAFVTGSAIFTWWAGAPGERRLDPRHMKAFASLVAALVVFMPISLWVGRYLVNNAAPWNPLWNLFGSIAYYVPPYLALTAVAGAVFLTYERDDLGAALLTLVVVPIVLLGLASEMTIASAAYVLAITVPVAWLAGVALDRVLQLTRPTARWAGVILAAGLFMAQTGDLVLYHTVYHGLKPRWKEAARYVAANREPGDVVAAAEADVMSYYTGDNQVQWYSNVEAQIADGTFPPSGAAGAWYVIYMADAPLTHSMEGARSRALHDAKLRLLLPLHYGPKDRTLGVFYQPASASAPAP